MIDKMTKTGNKFIDDHFIVASAPAIDPSKLKSKAKAPEKPMVRVDWKHSGHGWTVGDVYYKGKRYPFEMKNFLEPSVYGIDNGCISKLFVKTLNGGTEHTIYGKVLINYDRGWDIRPTTADAKSILKALKDRFNNGMNREDEKMYRLHVW